MYNFDFPLSPKARTYLKLEKVFKNVEQTKDLNSIQHVMFLLRSIVDFIDLVDGSSAIKIDLIKDLEKCDSKLKGWLSDPECDKDFVEKLREGISEAKNILDGFTRQRTVLKDDPIIEMIKPRFLTPSGVNCFDTPLFDFWFELPEEEKKKSVDKWLHELECIRIPVYTILYLWRLCTTISDRVAKSGFMQENADTCDLINIQYENGIRAYPVVSGFQSRVNIRFLPFDKGAPVGDIPFKIAYVKSSLQ
ncbi:MAG: cell division protein ZapD [Succinivibrio sp.]|jgi:cell division FtsZ-interacting protein ZapD|nr:cell division protein ZapD [Succinivibrio sp.]